MTRRRKIVIGAAVLIVVLIILFIRFLLAPADGVVSNPQPNSDQARKSTLKQYDGKNMRFKYPGTFSQTGAGDAGAGYDEAARFVGPDYDNALLAIAVRPGSLATDPSVTDRQRQGAVYKQEVFNLDGASGISFTRTSGAFEKSGFVVREGQLVSVALSDPGGGEQQNTFDEIVKSWSWK